jgi:hypothetical protein
MPELLFIGACFCFLFLILFLRTKPGDPGRFLCLLSLVGWLASVAYEFFYIREWLKTIRGAPIRADLLVFGLPLVVISLVALVRLRKRNSASRPPS